MRKIVTGVFIFFFTLFIGIGIYFAWYTPIQLPNVEIDYLPVESSTEPNSVNVAEDSTEIWILAVKPCTKENNIKQPSLDWRGKEIADRGVANHLVICGALPEYPLEAKKKGFSVGL